MIDEERENHRDFTTSKLISDTASLAERLKAFAADLDKHTEMLKEFERREFKWKS